MERRAVERLIAENGKIQYGLFTEPVGLINYTDYPLQSPMGRQWPAMLRRLKFNQFVFTGIIAPNVIAGAAIIDLKYLSSAFLYVYNRLTGEFLEIEKIGAPLSWKRYISPTPEQVSAKFESARLSIVMENDRFSARSEDMEIDVQLQPMHDNPLRICSRAGYTGWVYTQKTTPIGVSGQISAGADKLTVDSTAMAFRDWTAGYMRRETFWNWAATAAVLPDGKSFGMNLACGVNETGFTENAFWIDGRMTKIDTVYFDYNLSDSESPWHVRSADGRIDLAFQPEKKRSQKVNAGLIATRFTQFIGSFSGVLLTSEGDSISISECPGWVEDHFARW